MYLSNGLTKAIVGVSIVSSLALGSPGFGVLTMARAAPTGNASAALGSTYDTTLLKHTGSPTATQVRSYLARHADLTAELYRNPALINDPTFLRNHREITDFLHDHHDFAKQVKKTPGSFMQRLRWYHRSAKVHS